MREKPACAHAAPLGVVRDGAPRGARKGKGRERRGVSGWLCLAAHPARLLLLLLLLSTAARGGLTFCCWPARATRHGPPLRRRARCERRANHL